MRIVALEADAVLVVPDGVRSDWGMVAGAVLAHGSKAWVIDWRRCSGATEICTYLTCSLTRLVVPASSSHLPRKSSPKKGFRGFFSLPSFSERLAYCCLSVVRNHFMTSMARLAGSCSAAGATKTEGCSVQYDENSVSDFVERIKAGAVMVERSPLKDAIDCAGG